MTSGFEYVLLADKQVSVKRGDIFASGAQCLVAPVNTIGVAERAWPFSSASSSRTGTSITSAAARKGSTTSVTSSSGLAVLSRLGAETL